MVFGSVFSLYFLFELVFSSYIGGCMWLYYSAYIYAVLIALSTVLMLRYRH